MFILKDVQNVFILTDVPYHDYQLRCLIADLFSPRTFTGVSPSISLPIELNDGNFFSLEDVRSRQSLTYPNGKYNTFLKISDEFARGDTDNYYGCVSVYVVKLKDLLQISASLSALSVYILFGKMPGKRNTFWKHAQNYFPVKGFQDKYYEALNSSPDGAFVMRFTPRNSTFFFLSVFF